MKSPSLSTMRLRSKAPTSAVHCGSGLYEILVESDPVDNPISNALRIARTTSAVEVLASTESSSSSMWRVLTTNPDIDIAWLGDPVPHSKPLKVCGSSKGSYVKTSRGTWRVGMQMIPVVNESAERSRLISYRGRAGVSVEIKDGKLALGFTLESANPRDGTQICQSALLNTASRTGVRCEIMEDPRFASMVDELNYLRSV